MNTTVDTAIYCDQIRRHCPSCCFMERIFGQMSPPLMDGWTSEMSCEKVQSWENTFFQGAKWSRWSRKRPGERDHQLHNKLPIDPNHITSYHWQIIKWHYKLQSTTNFFQQVLESIIGGRIVQVIHQSLDGCSVWLGTTQLLNGQANVLVGAGAAADMAGSAGRDKQTLAANHLLLGQGGGLALLVHLKFEMAMDATRNNQVNTAPIPSITPLCQPDSIVEIAACVKHKIKKYYVILRNFKNISTATVSGEVVYFKSIIQGLTKKWM